MVRKEKSLIDLAQNAHEFLDYKEVDVHFIYGFLWKSSALLDPNAFRSVLKTKPNGHINVGDWIKPYLHERVIGNLDTSPAEASWIGSYQPTFIMGRRFFEKTGFLLDEDEDAKAWLVAPLKFNIQLPGLGATPLATSELEMHEVKVSWTIRVFGTGTGTFTIRVSLSGLDKINNRAKRFLKIHHLLRLVPNVDLFPEAHQPKLKTDQNIDWPISDSFLYTKKMGTCRLFEIMKHYRETALKSFPGNELALSKSDDNPLIEIENLELDTQEKSRVSITPPKSLVKAIQEFKEISWEEKQTPFTFVTTVLSTGSLKKLRVKSVMRAKEFGSIYARLTLDNRNADKNYSLFTENYLIKALRFDKDKGTLPDFSHDEKLFFSFCRRGAVAATATPNALPALFVIPSLLNLFEIIRARLFAGLAISARLTDLAYRLAVLDPSSIPISQTEYASLRKLVVANLENPLEYLFDGGSATEMALDAEEALFVRKTWGDVRRSFDVVDRLMSSWEAERFKKQYGGY